MNRTHVICIVFGLLLGGMTGYHFGLHYTVGYAAELCFETIKSAHKAGRVLEYGTCQENLIRLLDGLGDRTP